MISALLDILGDEALRSNTALEAHVAAEYAAGTPWLIEE